MFEFENTFTFEFLRFEPNVAFYLAELGACVIEVCGVIESLRGLVMLQCFRSTVLV